MARPVLLQQRFDGGMKPDLGTTGLPSNAVWRMVDFIPSLEGPLTLRQGWDTTGLTLGNSYVAAVAFAPFSGGAQLVGITDTGAVKQVPHTSDSSVTARGTAFVPLQVPVFYRDRLYITSNNGTAVPKYYDGTNNVADVTTSPPAGMIGTVYKDHLVLARSSANPNRIWFSSGGDPTSWDTAADGQWLDASYPVTGMATLRNMILVFQEQGVERVRGDIIPGVSGSDMVREPAFGIGCADPASIATTDEYCVYANAVGVFLTDGVGIVDLTYQCGVRNWWNYNMFSYDSNWTLAAGLFQGKYVISAMNGSSFEFCLVIDIANRVAYEFSNVPSVMFASAPAGHASSYPGALYMADRSATKAVRFSSVWQDAHTVSEDIGFGNSPSADGNGTLQSPRLKTGAFLGTPGKKRWRRIYVGNFFHTTSGTLTVNVYPDELLDADNDFNAGSISSAASHDHVIRRTPFAIHRQCEAIAIEVFAAPLTAASDVRIHRLEADVTPVERSR